MDQPIRTLETPGAHDSWFVAETGLPDFPAIEPQHALELLRSLVEACQASLADALAQPNDWQLLELEAAWADELARVWAPISHMHSVADSPQWREAYQACLQLLTEHETWRSQHRGLCLRYRELLAAADTDAVSAEQRRIVELEVRDFHLSGVDLDEPRRSQYAEIVQRLSALGTQFQANLMDATRGWSKHITDPHQLRGLPAAELRLLASKAREKELEGWLVDLSYPSFSAVVTHAEDRDLRFEVYRAYATRASDQGPNAGQWDNTPVIEEMLALRHRLAGLLGFHNYADYALAPRMAASSADVLAFLQGLAGHALEPAREQFRVLQNWAREQGAETPLQAWDTAYWTEQYRKAVLHLSDEELKPYFPTEAMWQAVQYVAHRLFGVQLRRDTNVPVWNTHVAFYWLHDTDGQRMAGLYLDLYTRPEKRGGAWMDICRSRRVVEGQVQIPVAFLNCNFPPPVDDYPSLLTHHDVETLFHEFGHCLHHMLTGGDWPQINGLSRVEWDAVELPSQLLENWCWDDEILMRFARHYRTGENLPAELKARLLRSRHFQKATVLMRQLEYGLCDFRMHLEYQPEQPRNPLELMQEIRDRYALVPPPDWNRFLHSFSHIFGGGYSAGYYSYLWAEQLAADAWNRFVEEGVLNADTGASLRDEILSVGAARPAMESFVAFRGRPPVDGPLLQAYGLDPEPLSATARGQK